MKKNPFASAAKYIAKPYGMAVYMVTTREAFLELEKWMKVQSEDMSIYGGQCAHYTCDGENVLIVAWFNKRIGTLSHECFHACGRIFEIVGAKYDVDNDEPFAYLMGDMVQYFWENKKC